MATKTSTTNSEKERKSMIDFFIQIAKPLLKILLGAIL